MALALHDIGRRRAVAMAWCFFFLVLSSGCCGPWGSPLVVPVSAQTSSSRNVTSDNLEALLAIKAALTDPHDALASWNASEASGACADAWAGVTCSESGEVTVLQLAGLGLGGTLSESVGQLRNLRKLNVHTNAIGGPVPAALAALPRLRALYLHRNRLEGPVPVGLGAGAPGLQRLDLSGNLLTGPLTDAMAASPRLLLLNVSDNRLTGGVPPGWARNPSVQSLSAYRNQLEGAVPRDWAAGGLQVLELGGNRLDGEVPAAGLAAGAPGLVALDLADNALTGGVPEELGDLRALQRLNLSGNRLTGRIPDSLARLDNLTSLDVSRNALSGRVPPALAAFAGTAFADNPGLCAAGDNNSTTGLPLCAAGGGGGGRRKLSAVAWVGISLGIAIVAAAVAIALVVVWRRRSAGGKSGKRRRDYRNQQQAGGASPSPGGSGSEGGLGGADSGSSTTGGKLVHFPPPLGFTVEDLLRATAEVLGKSSYGTVYKATLEDGTSVAVKRLRDGTIAAAGGGTTAHQQLTAQVAALGALRHPNLLPLRAFYRGPKSETLLVYDYVPLGSLAAYLHGLRAAHAPLRWPARLGVATGTARALAFLHLPPHRTVHGNLTASNILLDRRTTPLVSDYGLARLMTPAAHSAVIATAGALGYRAPELARTGKDQAPVATFKSDVYSFGIVLLELLTGRAPSDPTSAAVANGAGDHDAAGSLPDWVASVVREEWTHEVFDTDLLVKESPPETQDQMLAALQLALTCVAPHPDARPDMDEVLLHLEELSPASPLLEPDTAPARERS